MTSTLEPKYPVPAGAGRQLSPPDPGYARPKANGFVQVSGANRAPLSSFPYHDAGSIEPCARIVRGDPACGVEVPTVVTSVLP